MKGLGVLALAFVAYVVAAGTWRQRYAPAPGVSDYAGLRNQGVPMTEARRVAARPGHVCVFGDVRPLMWTLPSGPPAYLFDASGRLVDHTLDVGDSNRFQADYEVYAGPVVPLPVLEREFGLAP